MKWHFRKQQLKQLYKDVQYKAYKLKLFILKIVDSGYDPKDWQ